MPSHGGLGGAPRPSAPPISHGGLGSAPRPAPTPQTLPYFLGHQLGFSVALVGSLCKHVSTLKELVELYKQGMLPELAAAVGLSLGKRALLAKALGERAGGKGLEPIATLVHQHAQPPTSVAIAAAARPPLLPLERIPGMWVAPERGPLRPLMGAKPTHKTPADFGIPAAAGDDTTPVNAVKAGMLNAVVTHAVANVGFSASGAASDVVPSAIHTTVELTDEADGGYGLAVDVLLEYSNPHPKESMVVKLKKLRQRVREMESVHDHDPATELVLLETKFMDESSDGKWVDISSSIRYTAEAEVVQQAVLTSADVDQTAGTMKQTGLVESVVLGPVGTRGRVLLRYRCGRAFSYKQMSVADDRSDARRDCIPVAVHLPFCADLAAHAAGGTRVAVTFKASPLAQGCRPLSARHNMMAYSHCKATHLKEQHVVVPAAACAASSEASPVRPAHTAVWTRAWPCLPPRPTVALFWWSVPSKDAVLAAAAAAAPVAAAAAGGNRLVLREPAAGDAELMRVALPGGCRGRLLKAELTTAASAAMPPGAVRLHTNITISDGSGSTGARAQDGSGATVRAKFNAMATRRLVRRLETLPVLVARGVVVPDAYMAEVLYIFDTRIKKQCSFLCRIGDVTPAVAKSLVAVLDATSGAAAAAAALRRDPATAELLRSAKEYVDLVSAARPGGGTSFGVPANAAAAEYGRVVTELRARVAKKAAGGGAISSSWFKGPNWRNPNKTKTKTSQKVKVVETSYINFDTDGGHNYGDCYTAIREMTATCHVVGGVVNGYGAWVDQTCAGKVAKLLGGPCMLSLKFPPQDALDQDLRLDLSEWIKAFRCLPVSLGLHAGFTTWRARQGLRFESRLELLAVRAAGQALSKAAFGTPDVKAIEFVVPNLENVRAGAALTCYLLERGAGGNAATSPLAEALRISVNGSTGGGGGVEDASSARTEVAVQVAPEKRRGILLANEWLQTLTGATSDVLVNKSVLSDRLRMRLEDDLSFQYNLPVPSGATALLGRAKTEHRAPIPPHQQPKEPELEFDIPLVDVTGVAALSDDSDDDCCDMLGGGSYPTPWAAPAAQMMMQRSAFVPASAPPMKSRSSARSYARRRSPIPSPPRHGRWASRRGRRSAGDSVPPPPRNLVATPAQILTFSHCLEVQATPAAMPASPPLPTGWLPDPSGWYTPTTVPRPASMSAAPKNQICPRGHQLTAHRTSQAGYVCDGCGKRNLPQNTLLHGCRICDFDLCPDCVKGHNGRLAAGISRALALASAAAGPQPNVAIPGQTGFPPHWGSPPTMCTRDMQIWPGGYGRGSGTVGRWIQQHMDEDRRNGVTGTGAGGDVASIIDSVFAERPSSRRPSAGPGGIVAQPDPARAGDAQEKEKILRHLVTLIVNWWPLLASFVRGGTRPVPPLPALPAGPEERDLSRLAQSASIGLGIVVHHKQDPPVAAPTEWPPSNVWSQAPSAPAADAPAVGHVTQAAGVSHGAPWPPPRQSPPPPPPPINAPQLAAQRSAERRARLAAP